MNVQQPVVAGMFYPGTPDALAGMVGDLLARAPELDVPRPKAVVLPHAGYTYSGGVAAAGAVALGPGPRRVVILGPSHRHAFRGVALPPSTALATPLGEIPVDLGAAETLLRDPDVAIVPEAFAAEHSIEVELPFLQARLGAFSVVPLVVGDIATARLAEILETVWGGPETLIVISTDLTHFLTAREAEKVDLGTADRVERLDATEITGFEACGHRPLAAFLDCAARRGLRLTRLALTHSGAVSGDRARVVGYGAWMAHDPEEARLSPDHRRQALEIARDALAHRAARGAGPDVVLADLPVPLQGTGPVFVTLTQEGRLRGCIGTITAHRPLGHDIVENAVKSGFADPRFQPMTAAEVDATAIEIAVLSQPAPMAFRDEAELKAQLRPGLDGVILEAGGKRATFLPKVWEQLETTEVFLGALKAKAGLAADHRPRELRVWRYVTEAFTDEPIRAG